MDMNEFTGKNHKPNLNPDNEEVGLRKPVFMRVCGL
jgi:hypothetical protein